MAFERLGGLFGRLKDRFGEGKVYQGNVEPMMSEGEVPFRGKGSQWDLEQAPLNPEAETWDLENSGTPSPQGGVPEPVPTFGAKSLSFLDKQMDRLGIDPSERDAFTKNIYDWSRQVRNIESDDNPMAAAGKYDEFGNLTSGTSAKGVYQFTDASVDTGKGRMRNMGFDDELIQGIHKNPQQWTDEQSDAMFLGNIFAQTDSDREIRKIGGGDMKARQDAYYQFHHTDPDEATTARVNRMMPYDNQPVDDTMQNFHQSNLANLIGPNQY